MKNALIRNLTALVLAFGLVAGMGVLVNASTSFDGLFGNAYDAEWDSKESVWKIVSNDTDKIMTTISTTGPNGETPNAGPAADTTDEAPGFSLQIEENNAKVLKDGNLVKNYSIRNGKMSFTSDDAGNMLMQFVDGEGQTKLVSFGKETLLTVAGFVETMTFERSFNKNAFVNIAEKSVIQHFVTNSSSTFNNRGNISHAEINGGATFISGKNSSTGAMTIANGNAKVITDTASSIGKIYTSSSYPLSSMSVSAGKIIYIQDSGKPVYNGSGSGLTVYNGKPIITGKVEKIENEPDDFDEDEEEVPTVGATGTITDNITTTK